MLIDWSLSEDLPRTLAAVEETYERIRGFVWPTPTVKAAGVTDVPFLVKAENLQRSGSFKIRGAAACATAAPQSHELITGSTGNHGLAVAFVARDLGMRCRVFTPAGASEAKLERLRDAGSVVVKVAGDALVAETEARRASEGRSGTLFIPPYNDAHVVLGQATLALDLTRELLVAPDAIFMPLGGGGLAAGVGLVAAAVWPSCTRVGCSPATSPVMQASVAAGRVVECPVEDSLSDGTAGNIEADTLTFPICAALIDRFETVSEAEIADSMRNLAMGHRLVVEGSGAVAAAVARRWPGQGTKVAIASGGNVGVVTFRHVLAG